MCTRADVGERAGAALFADPGADGDGLCAGFFASGDCFARRCYGFGFGLFDTNNVLTSFARFIPPRLRATGYGVMNFAGIAAGAWLTPLLGKLKDHGVSAGAGLLLFPPHRALLAAILHVCHAATAGARLRHTLHILSYETLDIRSMAWWPPRIRLFTPTVR